MSDSSESVEKQTAHPDDQAVAEALEQLYAIDAGEEERRRSADNKTRSAEIAIGFIVTLAGGSAGIAFIQAPFFDLWHILVSLALAVAAALFLVASFKVIAANDPRPYQMRVASGVARMIREGASKRDLQADAVKDLVGNIEANIETNNERMTAYRGTIEIVRWGICAIACVPFIVLVAYLLNAFLGPSLPSPLKIQRSSIPSPAVSAQLPGQQTRAR